MRLGELTLEKAAEAARGNWQEFNCFAWHDKPADSADWCIIYTANRDSGLLDLSNAEAIQKALAPFMEGDDPDIRAEHHSHWACGYVDGYAIRVYRDSKITEAFAAYHDLAERLANYPVLDEEDYSKREYDATLENIANEGRYANREDLYRLPDGWESEVFTWLWDNNDSAVANNDDQGGYPTVEELQEAFDGLGWRIQFVVSWLDCGQHTETFRDESEAAERVEALRAEGHISATYAALEPAPVKASN